MKIREYRGSDLDAVARLFYETVHTVNVADYTVQQLFAWANNAESLKMRRNDLVEQNTLVAEVGGEITGFGSVDKYGCLDLLFVHKDFQGQGIATALCNELEKDFFVVTTYASLTARPFFEQRGYTVQRACIVRRSGVKLKNFLMRKEVH